MGDEATPNQATKHDESLTQSDNEWQKKTFKLKKWALGISIFFILIFFAAIVTVVAIQFASKKADWQLSAEICNTFTGIVLGFVAMAVSIISIVLGFYNTIQAENSNIASIKQFTEISQADAELSSSLTEVSSSLTKDMEELSKLIKKQSEFDELLKSISADLQEVKKQKNNSEISVTPEIQSATGTSEKFDD